MISTNPFFADMNPQIAFGTGENVQAAGEKPPMAKSIWIILLVVFSIAILIKVILK